MCRPFGCKEEDLMMMQAFYQSKPIQDTPYRQLSLDYDEGWHVQLFGGIKWGAKGKNILQNVPVRDFDEGREVYDKMFVELQNSGWRAYTPYESWD
jgi:hypothetical protein